MTSEFPASQGYRMPAEWEPHEATWLTWPHNSETWPGQNMKSVEKAFLHIINALQSGEKVNILVNNAASNQYVLDELKRNEIKNTETFIIPTDDSWIRDYGPNFILKENTPGKPEIAVNKWNFNSWGKKYDWQYDNRAGSVIAERLAMKVFEPGIVLEPGAIEVNGLGTCITTERCLLDKNRNEALTRSEAENILKNYLGVKHIIWRQGDLQGDDTDGHIDNLARFVNPTTLLCAWEDDPSDPNYAVLKKNLEILQNSVDQDGYKFNIIKFPMPGFVGDNETRLPASYANFYIGNKTVLLPVYGKPDDAVAHSILQEYFPGREVVDIQCNILIWGLGGIHCLTQQQPAG